jgi:nitroreductase
MDRATVDHLLTTTRTVRRRLDLGKPVEPEVIQECLELAIQAPNGGGSSQKRKRSACGGEWLRPLHPPR